MALLFSFLPIVEYFSLIAPTIIALFILFAGVLNKDLKGLIYIAGLMISLIIGIMIKPFFGGSVPQDAHAACNIFGDSFPNSNFSNPSLDTLAIAFSAAYLLIPMFVNGTINLTIIISFILVLFTNGMFRLKLTCNQPLDIIIGCLIGLLCGGGFYAFIKEYGGDKYLFFSNTDSNNVMCDKPSSTKFKCVVYKNGEIIKQL
jgi:hypothetical protein